MGKEGSMNMIEFPDECGETEEAKDASVEEVEISVLIGRQRE